MSETTKQAMTRENAIAFMERELAQQQSGVPPAASTPPAATAPPAAGTPAPPTPPPSAGAGSLPPVAAAAGTATAAGLDGEELDALLAAREAVPPVDPRVAWREEQVRAIVARGLMPEALARATVNGAKKADIETWLAAAPAPAVGSPVPPQGQPATPALPAPGGPATPPVATRPVVAPSESRQPIPAAAVPDDHPLLARLAVLEQTVLGDRRAQGRAEFAAAATELSAEFPRIRTPTGALDSEVGEAAKALLKSPKYAGASAKTLLRAAAAATFSTGPGASDVPVTTSPRTPIADSVEGYKAPLNKYDRGALVIEIRRKWGNGDPNNLSPEQEANAAAEISRVLRMKR